MNNVRSLVTRNPPENPNGAKIEYGTRRCSPLWNNQLSPYIH